MDRVEQGDRLLGLVRLELADQVQADVRDGARAAPAISPAPPAPDSRRNRAGPAAISASIASAGWVLETAIRVTSSGSRPASAAALPIRAWTSARDESAMAAAIGRAMRPPASAAPLADDRRAARATACSTRSRGCPTAPASSFAITAWRKSQRRALFDRVRAAAPRRCCCSPARPSRRGPGAPTAATAAAAARACAARRSTI